MFEDRKLQDRVMTLDINQLRILRSLITSESNDRNMAATRNVDSVSF
jgi:hypothetical protein